MGAKVNEQDNRKKGYTSSQEAQDCFYIFNLLSSERSTIF